MQTHCPKHKIPYIDEGLGLWSCPVEDCPHHTHSEGAPGFEMVLCPICYEVVWQGTVPEGRIAADKALETHHLQHNWVSKASYWLINKLF